MEFQSAEYLTESRHQHPDSQFLVPNLTRRVSTAVPRGGLRQLRVPFENSFICSLLAQQ
jgi:hypothetical protein